MPFTLEPPRAQSEEHINYTSTKVINQSLYLRANMQSQTVNLKKHQSQTDERLLEKLISSSDVGTDQLSEFCYTRFHQCTDNTVCVCVYREGQSS